MGLRGEEGERERESRYWRAQFLPTSGAKGEAAAGFCLSPASKRGTTSHSSHMSQAGHAGVHPTKLRRTWRVPLESNSQLETRNSKRPWDRQKDQFQAGTFFFLPSSQHDFLESKECTPMAMSSSFSRLRHRTNAVVNCGQVITPEPFTFNKCCKHMRETPKTGRVAILQIGGKLSKHQVCMPSGKLEMQFVRHLCRRERLRLECSTTRRSHQDYADWVIDQIDPDRWETQPWELA